MKNAATRMNHRFIGDSTSANALAHNAESAMRDLDPHFWHVSEAGSNRAARGPQIALPSLATQSDQLGALRTHAPHCAVSAKINVTAIGVGSGKGINTKALRARIKPA